MDVGLVETWTRDSSGKTQRCNLEVDFVCNRGSERVYIQSAYALPSQEKVEQEERSLKSISDSFRKIVVVKDDILLRRNETGAVTMSLKDFLTKADSLEA